jgi:hypothetical protein
MKRSYLGSELTIRLAFPLLFDGLAVLSMRSDPKPDYLIILNYAQCSIIYRDANGINRARRMYTFEMEGRIIGVLFEP